MATAKTSVEPVASLAAQPRPKPVIKERPPLLQVEVLGAHPTPDHVWMPGHWEWDGNWTWVTGNWALPPSQKAAWVSGRWVRGDDGWAWVKGYWRLAALR